MFMSTVQYELTNEFGSINVQDSYQQVNVAATAVRNDTLHQFAPHHVGHHQAAALLNFEDVKCLSQLFPLAIHSCSDLILTKEFYSTCYLTNIIMLKHWYPVQIITNQLLFGCDILERSLSHKIKVFVDCKNMYLSLPTKQRLTNNCKDKVEKVEFKVSQYPPTMTLTFRFFLQLQ